MIPLQSPGNYFGIVFSSVFKNIGFFKGSFISSTNDVADITKKKFKAISLYLLEIV